MSRTRFSPYVNPSTPYSLAPEVQYTTPFSPEWPHPVEMTNVNPSGTWSTPQPQGQYAQNSPKFQQQPAYSYSAFQHGLDTGFSATPVTYPGGQRGSTRPLPYSHEPTSLPQRDQAFRHMRGLPEQPSHPPQRMTENRQGLNITGGISEAELGIYSPPNTTQPPRRSPGYPY